METLISTFFIFFSPTMVFMYKAPANKIQKKPQVKLQLSVMSFYLVFQAPAKPQQNHPIRNYESYKPMFHYGNPFR
jgi:hypothetical protein